MVESVTGELWVVTSRRPIRPSRNVLPRFRSFRFVSSQPYRKSRSKTSIRRSIVSSYSRARAVALPRFFHHSIFFLRVSRIVSWFWTSGRNIIYVNIWTKRFFSIMEDCSSTVKVRRWSCNRGGINYEKGLDGLDLNFCSLMEVWRFRESWGCRRCIWICEDSFVADSCLVWLWWSWRFWWDWDLYFVWNIRELVLLIEKILRTGKRTLFDEHYFESKEQK